ncbi:MAG TPA: hypothetical protein VGR14_11795 [Verrucomicrobiae bacterium]|nr:hypothetical protein [Verrucomicrobiae bacterium]
MAGIMSLLVPFLVACVQSALVVHRGYRLGFAMLDGFNFKSLLRFEFWPEIALMALISFLILLPFLRSPTARRIILGCVCVGWTWFIFTFVEAATKGYGA